MHLLLIRHGETEHNVTGLLAGATDSRLTNHGVLQAQRLGKHLATTRQLRLTHVYASDLQRAWMTADELRKGQQICFGDAANLPETVRLELLREQDFGSLEMTPWASKQAFDAHDARTGPGFKPKETAEAMKARADQFIEDFLGPLWALANDPQSQCVAVVSHGLFLAMLWRTLIGRVGLSNIQLSPEVGPVSIDRPLEHLAAWTNTGFLELEVTSVASAPTASTVVIEHSILRTPEGRPRLSTLAMRVITINGRDHLLNLQRTRGGVGSAAHDTRQKQIDGFFKRAQSGA